MKATLEKWADLRNRRMALSIHPTQFRPQELLTMAAECYDALQAADAEVERLRTVTLLLLDHVDYKASNCRVNEMVGAVLPVGIISKARAALSSPKAAE